MDFVDYCTLAYKKLLDSDVKIEVSDKSSIFESFFNSISLNLSANELRKRYREGIYKTIDKELGQYKQEVEMLRSLKEVKFYENSISVYSSFIIFWILENNLKLNKEEIKAFTEAIYSGIIGYRLLDLHQDHNLFGGEIIILGYRFINLYEELLMKIFPGGNTFKTIKKNAAKYCEVEYVEKSNRWKQCPFNWEKVEILGNKAAPLFTIFELIFKRKKMSTTQVKDLLEAFRGLAVCTQLNDDLNDVEEDLLNGFETLIMKGFYAKYGKENITIETISEHLDQETSMQFYNTQVRLYNNARSIFMKYNQDLLLLLMELQYYQFNNNITIE